MDRETQLFLETLKKNRHSQTHERIGLFTLLKNQDKPITIQQLIELAHPALNRSTVYRTVDLFESLGIVSRLYTGWKFQIELSDTYSHHHHHMTCTNCDSIITFQESDTLVRELQRIETVHNFHASSHSLEFKGLCSTCQQMQKL